MDADEALALFKQGLESKDRMIALETAGKLGIVAKAMGPVQAKSVLLPFMEELTTAQRHEDEALCAFADTMDASFLPLVGGPTSCPVLVKLLMPLASTTETAVRSRAVKSLSSIIARIPGSHSSGGDATNFANSDEWAQLKGYVVALSALEVPGEEGAKKEDVWFPAKLSACQLFPSVFGCLPPDGMGDEKAQLLEQFSALSDDEMPMVRAVAAASLAGLSKHVTVEQFKNHLLPIFKLVSEDRSDVVRERGVKSLAAYLSTLPAVVISEADIKILKEADSASAVTSPSSSTLLTEVVTEVTGLYLKTTNDASWRVRLASVSNMDDALKPADAKTKGEMLAAFAELLEDEEGDVKLAATKATSKVYVAATSKDMFDALVLPTVLVGFQSMLDCAKQATEGAPDTSRADLRQAQALVAMELAAYDAIPHPMLISVVQHMFEDSALCIKMLEKIELLAKLKESDPAALSQICMDSLSLGVHDDWRVRCAFTAKLSFIFSQIISVESSAAVSTENKEETPKKSGPSASPSTPMDKDAVERAWTAFKSVVVGALWDEVAEARVHFVDCVPALIRWADKIGGDRYVKQLITMLLDQYKCVPGVPIPAHPDRKMSYLYKISVLAGLQAILGMSPAPPYLTSAANTAELVDLVLGAAKDPTPNVRLVAGKAVAAYAVACCGGYGASPGSLETVEMSLVPTLQAMASDSDPDVKDNAQISLAQVTEALNSAN
jgi:hypothetical protein